MRKEWTREEIAFLVENFNKMTIKEIAERLGRSVYSVRDKARSLGLRKFKMTSSNKEWTREEDEILRKYYSVLPKDELLKLLPNRSWLAIQARAEKVLKIGRSLLINQLYGTPKLELSREQLAYIAGLIDGEGTITLVKHGNKIYPEVSITNTCKELIDWLKKTIGFGIVSEERKKNRKWKICYKYRVVSIAEVYSLLKEIEPYLIVKKQQALLVLKFIETLSNYVAKEKRRNYILTPKLLEIYNKVRELNQRRSRTRQKIQEEGRYLPTDEEVLRRRRRLAQKYRRLINEL